MRAVSFSSKHSSARGIKIGDKVELVLDKYGGCVNIRQENKYKQLVYYHSLRVIENIAFNIDPAINRVTSISVSVDWD